MPKTSSPQLFACLLAAALPPISPSPSAERNIIFFITDDQSPTVGCYGDPIAATPALDALAADGTVFEFAFATTASCSASRSVVLSGIHNHKNGQYGHQHHFHKFSSYWDLASLTLPRVLAQQGYRTAQIGKYHVGPEPVYHFETYLRANPRNAVQMAEVARDFIADDDPRPFFLYFATSDPHRGGGTDESFPGDLKPDLFGNLKGGASHEGVDEVFYKPAEVPVPPYLPDTPESRAELAHYYQSVARIDQGLARLVEILVEHDLFDKTLVVFTSDHGLAFPGGKTTVYEAGLHVPFVVRDPYQKTRGVRSQALVSHVDITPSLLDFAGGLDHKKNAPANWQSPQQIFEDSGLWEHIQRENRSGNNDFTSYQGRSWLPILGDEQPAGWDQIFASHTFHEIQMYYPMRVLRDRQYKLIWNIAHGLPYPFASDLWAASTWQAQFAKGPSAPYGQRTVREYIHRPAFELYDIAADPHESRNLAADPANSELLARYQAKLKELQAALEDPWITKWDYE